MSHILLLEKRKKSESLREVEHIGKYSPIPWDEAAVVEGGGDGRVWKQGFMLDQKGAGIRN